ncbi:hypothetical protein KUTeg_017027 [Tegillarca granosa]|uniref:Organic solute transporter alpha-like protein n=1 Tax=Tegillarca granosa TaxID=220873 RepID=A0ABQ9ERB5_TEGGR|nr:hypothetical protein KUTeg_017027 [Tegillarca granosa]
MSSNNTSVPKCTNDFPSTRQIYSELGDDVDVIILTAVVGILSLVTVGIILESVWYLIYNVKNKSRRVKLICLLALYPVVSITSLHSLLVPTSTLIGEFAASIYLSFCILLFVQLIIHYYGGDQEILEALKDTDIDFNTPPCCCCCLCLRKIPFHKRTLKILKLMVLQVAADPESPTLYINLLNAMSTLFAIYGMMSTIIAILARFAIPPCSGTRGSRVRASRFHHFLLIIEMFLLALLARFAYRRLDTAVPDTNDEHVTDNGENITSDDLRHMPNIDKQKNNSSNEYHITEPQTYI